ncbi:MAG: glycosyltransferase [Candidatus Omnitrophica bacterium]|nr:glycosyltransferase [Candidatus Omnitrophota bacterium]
MDQNPKVSVIIPTHNHVHFLPECLASVKSQTYQDYEVIVINNGSTDSTEELIQNLKWDKLRYYYQNDTGSVAGPRNTGIKMSLGEYIAFLDSDDVWYEQKLEKVMQVFQKHPETDIVSHDLWEVENKQKVRILTGKQDRPDMFEQFLLCGNCVCDVVIKRNSLNQLGGFDESKDFVHVEDYELWLRMAYLHKKFYFLNECLGEYRKHSSNLSNDFNSVFKNEINVIKKHFKNYKGKNALEKFISKQTVLSRITFKISRGFLINRKCLEGLFYAILSFLYQPVYFIKMRFCAVLRRINKLLTAFSL